MRTSSLLLALPALALAQQQQKPLMEVAQDTFNEYMGKAQDFVASMTGGGPATAAKEAVTSTVANGAVTVLTMNNWKQHIKPHVTNAQKTEADEWMVYITGRNKTCGGLCGRADSAFNVGFANENLGLEQC